MFRARVVALCHAQQLRFDAWRAARRETEALRRAGQDLADHPPTAADTRLQPLFAALHPHRRELGRLSAALANSLEADRVDHGSVAAWIARERWVRALAHESRALGAEIWRQLHSRFAPRVSALAGLAAGWWVASRYTDSHLKSVINSLGIGRGGTHVVSTTTYKAMSFWLPILAAATCAYLGDRLARAIRHRYESGSSDSAAQHP